MKAFTVNLYEFGRDVFEYGKLIPDLEQHITAYYDPGQKTYFKDDRTQIGENGEPLVHLLGVDWQGYLYYVCPYCGQLHCSHKDLFAGRRRFRVTCTEEMRLDPEGRPFYPEHRCITLDKDRKDMVPGSEGWQLCRPWEKLNCKGGKR